MNHSVDIAENVKLIENFDFQFLKEKFQDAWPCTDQEFENVTKEFRKFLKLVLIQDEPIAMIGKSVDEFWHTFLIFTPQYREFCNRVFGEFIDHQPHTKSTPVPQNALTNFFRVYEQEFGEAEDLWTDGYDPSFIASLRNGEVPEDFTYKWSGWTGRTGKKK